MAGYVLLDRVGPDHPGRRPPRHHDQVASGERQGHDPVAPYGAPHRPPRSRARSVRTRSSCPTGGRGTARRSPTSTATGSLWRLPVSEHAMRFGHGVLLTLTDKAGPNDVRTLRARKARTGRVLATYRGTIFDSYVRWESSRRFVIMAADGLAPVDGELTLGQPVLRPLLDRGRRLRAGGHGLQLRRDLRGAGHRRTDRGQDSTSTRSPPSTAWVPESAIRSTVPAIGAVIEASIFIASMVATVSPACDLGRPSRRRR